MTTLQPVESRQRLFTQAHLENVTDIYLPIEPIDGKPKTSPGCGAYCYAGTPETIFVRDTPVLPFFDRLAEHVWQEDLGQPDSDYSVFFEGHKFRACRKQTDRGPQINLRRTPLESPRLQDLKLPPMWGPILLSRPLSSGGLILFAAETGQGKTTAASATVRSRLERFGGYALTVENPVEVPLDGVHGNGVCRQTSVRWDTLDERERGWAGAMRGALRSFPTTRGNILMVGEVRDAETAAELIQAAINGLVVISTVHALSIPGAVQRLQSLAESELGALAGEMLASALRVVVHQSLSLQEEGSGWRRGTITGRLLYSDGDSHTVANLIRTRQFAALRQPMELQENVVRTAGTLNLPVDDVLARIGAGGRGMT